ncbi:MAG: DUF4376 domain-containing protein [Bacteroidales bacterium]|nr:DUF4376 domain-containing protein [Bacteroidales bacterium]
MLKYCKILDEETGLVQLGVGCSDEYYIAIGMQLRDVEQSEKDFNWYITEKCPHKTKEEKLEDKRVEKFFENETKRETFLMQGVEYKGILFDSDLEQKINIMATVQVMDEQETITWVGKDGVTSLVCDKYDLLAIGGLLSNMTTYVWQIRNPEIKTKIENAKTIEELDAIDISYEMGA